MKYTDSEIIQGCAANKPIFQEYLYNKYSRSMLVLCNRYVRNLELAEDVFQESFVKIFKSIGSIKPDSVLEHWIRRVMINTALNQLRKIENKVITVEIEHHEDLTNDEFEKISEKFTHQVLLGMIHQLPDGYRTVFNMYVFDGYSHAEIAEILNINEGTSKSQLSRARAQLKEMLHKTEQNIEYVRK